jgi:hypothetical protein
MNKAVASANELDNRISPRFTILCDMDGGHWSIPIMPTFCHTDARLNIALADSIRKFSQTNETVLITSCLEKRAVETLLHHNLLGCFTRLICREALSESGLSNKHEKALALLGVNPAAVFVCENAAADIDKAMLAGVPKENIISVGCPG